MTATRRDFMKSLGISLASMILAQCTSHNDKLLSSVGSVPLSPAPPNNLPIVTSSASPTPDQKAGVAETRTDATPTSTTNPMEYESIVDISLPADKQLRQCWEKLPLIERHLYDPYWTGEDPRPMLIECHLAALNDLVVMGELSQAASEELHQAFIAAMHKVQSESLPLVCYD